ncbi:MAG: D-glycero-alpha-D-manno-heptose-1,7-bisphosphate 7-phosphatase [Burkholderiales bacterium]
MTWHRALFLDRDGVINHDSGYTSNKENFRFIDGIFDLCRTAINSGYLLIVVTNQAGIGRGYYSEQDFFMLTKWMREVFEAERAPITDVFHCPYHPEHGIGQFKKDSFDRKPNPGMLLRAAEQHGIALQQSIMIGDKDSDMQAAKNAGVGVRCQYLGNPCTNCNSEAATHQIKTLQEAIRLII